MATPQTNRRDTLKIRVSVRAHGEHRPVEQCLLDRTVFAVSPDAYADFLARLDEAPKPNERLRRTMQTVPPWE